MTTKKKTKAKPKKKFMHETLPEQTTFIEDQFDEELERAADRWEAARIEKKEWDETVKSRELEVIAYMQDKQLTVYKTKNNKKLTCEPSGFKLKVKEIKEPKKKDK